MQNWRLRKIEAAAIANGCENKGNKAAVENNNNTNKNKNNNYKRPNLLYVGAGNTGVVVKPHIVATTILTIRTSRVLASAAVFVAGSSHSNGAYSKSSDG